MHKNQQSLLSGHFRPRGGIRPGPTAAPEKSYRLRKVLRRNSTLSREDIQQETRQLEQELGRAFLIGKPSPEEVTVLS